MATRPVQYHSILNLGCPKFCGQETLCVDISPKDKDVIKMDAYRYLEMYGTFHFYKDIRTKNMLEHIPNVGKFLELCYTSLPAFGRLTVITDNAEFVPFYAPLSLLHTGIGAHNRNKYAIDVCGSAHLSIFTKMHLINLLELAGFHRDNIHVHRILMGSRLEAIAIK